MKRIRRDRKLTPEEAAKYKKVREQIADELPELIARHRQDSEAKPASRRPDTDGEESVPPKE